MNDKQFEQRLKNVLYRHDCPSADTLHQQYHSDLSSDEGRSVSAHVDDCVHCRAELAELAAVSSPATAPSAWQTMWTSAKQQVDDAAQVVGTLLSGNIGGASTKQPALVRRGEAEAQTGIFQLGNVGHLTIDIEPVDTLFRVNGTVMIATDLTVVTVTLRPAEAGDPVIARCNENGRFAFEQVPVGMYHLHLTHPDLETMIVPFLSVMV